MKYLPTSISSNPRIDQVSLSPKGSEYFHDKNCLSEYMTFK